MFRFQPEPAWRSGWNRIGAVCGSWRSHTWTPAHLWPVSLRQSRGSTSTEPSRLGLRLLRATEPVADDIHPGMSNQDLGRVQGMPVGAFSPPRQGTGAHANAGSWSSETPPCACPMTLAYSASERPCCRDQGWGRNDPDPVLGSCDADGLRASQV